MNRKKTEAIKKERMCVKMREREGGRWKAIGEGKRCLLKDQPIGAGACLSPGQVDAI